MFTHVFSALEDNKVIVHSSELSILVQLIVINFSHGKIIFDQVVMLFVCVCLTYRQFFLYFVWDNIKRKEFSLWYTFRLAMLFFFQNLKYKFMVAALIEYIRSLSENNIIVQVCNKIVKIFSSSCNCMYCAIVNAWTSTLSFSALFVWNDHQHPSSK